MFKGFNLKISKEFFGNKSEYEKYIKKGEVHLNEQKANYEEELEKYISDNTIDGSKIQNEWFPEIQADIFLSHSHNDKPLACALAGWINEEFGVTCFIDSTVWGYSGKLLEIMNGDLSNKRTSEDGGTLYDHNSCNQVSQHVNMMLSIALQKMIDKTEAIILLNTDNSIPVHNEDSMDKTYSPWIYSEIICTQLVRKKPLIAYRDYYSLSHGLFETFCSEGASIVDKIQLSYTISLVHLLKLDEEALQTWKDKKDNFHLQKMYQYEYPLDFLYAMVCARDVDFAEKMSEKISGEECRLIRNFYKGITVDAQDEEEIRKILNKCFEEYSIVYD